MATIDDLIKKLLDFKDIFTSHRHKDKKTRKISFNDLLDFLHKASHQNGGADEIDVDGLSGELADNQPPKSHALNSHSAPTGNIAMSNKKFTGLVDPNANQDSATKKYHDDNLPLVADFGDGSDGVVIISGNTTLTADKYYTNLTINNGVVLNTGGYKIYGTGTLLNNGIIENNGLNATNKNGAVGAPGNTVRGGTDGGNGYELNPTNFGGGGGSGAGTVFISFKIIDNTNGVIRANGGNGRVGSHNQCNANNNGIAGIALSVGRGGNGGAGGTAGGIGGAGGVVTVTKQTFNSFVSGMNVFDYVLNEGIGGGCGGGGGGLGCQQAGTGGGGGGGHVLIYYNSADWGSEVATGGTGGNNGSSGTVTKIEVG